MPIASWRQDKSPWHQGGSPWRRGKAPWHQEESRIRYDRATADLDPPFAIVDLDRFDANAAALVARSGGKPLRVASKSVRCRPLLRRVLAQAGWAGIMAFSLAEALWLARDGLSDDILVAYPTADRAGLRALAGAGHLASRVTLMVDSLDQLDFIDAVTPPGQRAGLRVCLELDASWRPLGERTHVGVRRSPVRNPAQAVRLAAAIAARSGFRLVGLMCYEAQIAGLGDEPPGAALRGLAVRAMQRRSLSELVRRRSAVVASVREHADLEFVNGGGTGSVARTAADPAVTEIAAGSGLFGPVLFDGYRAWQPDPAALFALSVVRHPTPRIATVLGGGWIGSGPPSASRAPLPWLPTGLRLLRAEGAGEVQTPVRGRTAGSLRVGDRVWFRHAKAGELCEHVPVLHLIQDDRVVDSVPTYRGEARAFL